MKIKLKLLWVLILLILAGLLLSSCVSLPKDNTLNTPSDSPDINPDSSDLSPSAGSPSSANPSETGANGSSIPQTEWTLNDYFPLIPDVFFDYGGSGNEYVPMTVWTEYLSDDSIQFSQDNGGTEVHQLYRIVDGQVILTTRLAELYVREDLRDRPVDSNTEILLQEPLEVGTSWLANGQPRSITAQDVQVTTPAGTFFTLEVTTEGEGTLTRQYYAPGIGLVKTTVTGDYEITQWLQERQTPKYRAIQLTLYYGQLTATDTEILAQEIPAEYRTNIGLKELLTRYFSEPTLDKMPRLISPDTKINSIQLDQQEGLVTIDFSPELVSQMNAGSSFEGVIIQCIVNTVGQAYGVEKVVITLDGQLYESGHIALGPGEFFGVDLTGIRTVK